MIPPVEPAAFHSQLRPQVIHHCGHSVTVFTTLCGQGCGSEVVCEPHWVPFPEFQAKTNEMKQPPAYFFV